MRVHPFYIQKPPARSWRNGGLGTGGVLLSCCLFSDGITDEVGDVAIDMGKDVGNILGRIEADALCRSFFTA